MSEVYTCVCGGQVFKIHNSTITCPACERIYDLSMMKNQLESPEDFNSRIRPPEKEKE